MKKLFPKILAGAVIAGLSLTASAEQLDHFIINGQSLSTGHQSWPVVSTENVPGNFMLGNQIWNNYGHDWEAAMHPLIGTVAKQFQNDGGNGTKDGGAIAECPLLGAVNHLQLKYGTHNPRIICRRQRRRRRGALERVRDTHILQRLPAHTH